MYYNFNINGEVKRVFINDLAKVAMVEEGNKQYDRTIRNDKNGDFFTWNKCKIYLNDFEKVTVDMFNLMVDNKEWITSDTMRQMLLTEGVDNIKVYAPMYVIGSGNNYDEFIECKIVTRWNRDPKDNYKLVLVPIDNDTYAEHDMYTMDMISFVRDKRIVFERCKTE